MPSLSNYMNLIYVHLGFVAQITAMAYFKSIIEIRENWPLYRCNPPYWIFSNDISADFTYCVQNTQVNLMGYLMQPFTYLLGNLTEMATGFGDSISSIRSVISNVRSFTTGIVENIFSIFVNLITEMERLILNIKDTMGKVIGVVVTMMYVLDGSLKTMQSAWKGPSGELVRKLGSCFEPSTKIKLKNGEIYLIKDLPLGSVLEDGSIVLSVMKIVNNEQLYKVKGGINNENIYVTGSHFVYSKKRDKFIQVKDYEYAENQNIIKCEWVSSLITSNRRIIIGDHIFWDWEDDELTNKM
jgi:23S rRNA A1618 N6-methylase RlmF